MQHLSDPDLWRTDAYINGEWVSTSARFDVLDPADRTVLASVAECDATLTNDAIAAADRAFSAWAARRAADRAQLMRALADALLASEDDLARLIGLENGKPLAEAVGEVRYAAGFLTWFAEQARRVDGSVIESPWERTTILATREPVGVAALITPWNFPAAMFTRKLGPALATGCTVVLKPAEQTPLTALAIAALAHRVGFPAGVINVVTGSADAAPVIGEALTSSRTVRKVSFTGSTAVGKLIAAQCASTVKRVSLELGGNAPLIVFDDADLDTAVAGTIAAKFRNAGQTCVAANRVFVQSGIAEEYTKRLTAAVAELTVGRFDSGSAIGPMIDDDATAKVRRHISDAIANGATVVSEGSTNEAGDQFVAPIILANTTASMQCHQEETFGPVVSLTTFDTVDEVVEAANDTDSGLAAYFFTNDLGRSHDVSKRLQFGIVGVNTGVISAPEVPFGGMKESGYGREGSAYGTDDWTEIKYTALAHVAP